MSYSTYADINNPSIETEAKRVLTDYSTMYFCISFRQQCGVGCLRLEGGMTMEQRDRVIEVCRILICNFIFLAQ
jgi:hypothetical protein